MVHYPHTKQFQGFHGIVDVHDATQEERFRLRTQTSTALLESDKAEERPVTGWAIMMIVEQTLDI